MQFQILFFGFFGLTAALQFGTKEVPDATSVVGDSENYLDDDDMRSQLANAVRISDADDREMDLGEHTSVGDGMILGAPEWYVNDLKATNEASSLQNEVSRFPSDSYSALGSKIAPVSRFQKKQRFLIGIGVPKSASTYAYWVLRQHENVTGSQVKETRYFDPDTGSQGCHGQSGHSGGSEEKYVDNCYPHYASNPKNGGNVLMEFSPQYMGAAVEKVVENIKRVSQDSEIRFVAIIREPIARLASQLTMKRFNGHNEKTDEILGKKTVRELGNGHFDYGHYAESLHYYIQAFGRDKVLVVNNDALRSEETWKRILQHAGLQVPSQWELQHMMAKATGAANKADGTYVKFNSTYHAELEEHFSQWNDKLWNLLDVKSPWW